MTPKWLKLASPAQKNCTLCTFRSLVHSLHPKDNLFKTYLKNIHKIPACQATIIQWKKLICKFDYFLGKAMNI